MLIYKIFRRPEWDDMVAQGHTSGAPVDLKDGYIHFSTAAQVMETAAKHFAQESDLVLIAVNEQELGADLKWEPSRGGICFRICTGNCAARMCFGTLPCHLVRPDIFSRKGWYEHP